MSARWDRALRLNRALAAALAAALLSAPLVVAPTVGAQAGERSRSESTPAEQSDRSRTLARLDCLTGRSRRELTLFANGTLRLKTEEEGVEKMALAELGPEELDEEVRLLDEVDLSETDAESGGPEGESVESCTLVLTLPGREPVTRRFRQFDSRSLALSRAVGVLEGIAARLEAPRPSAGGGGPERLPPDYRPEIGDVVRHADGVLYRVVAFTADGDGVELQGVEQPLTLYLARDRMAEVIVELVQRREH